jgi:hypothetical protein
LWSPQPPPNKKIARQPYYSLRHGKDDAWVILQKTTWTIPDQVSRPCLPLFLASPAGLSSSVRNPSVLPDAAQRSPSLTPPPSRHTLPQPPHTSPAMRRAPYFSRASSSSTRAEASIFPLWWRRCRGAARSPVVVTGWRFGFLLAATAPDFCWQPPLLLRPCAPAPSPTSCCCCRSKGGWKELEGGRLARRDRRRETFGSSRGRPAGGLLACLRCEREADGSSRGRPEGGQRREGRRRAAGEGRRELELEHGRPPSRWRRVEF